MQLSLLQEHLKRGLSIVSRAVATKSHVPVMMHVLLRADDTGLHLAGTNLELSIRTTVGARVDQHGAVTLPAKLLNDVVAGLPNDTIKISLNDTNHTVTLKCGRFETEIHGLDAEEFPYIPTISNDPIVSMQPDVLRTALQRTIIAASNTSDRLVLSGVYFDIGTGITLVGADGFRLAVQFVEVETNNKPVSFIVPAKVLDDLVIVVGEEVVDIAVTDNISQVLFRCGSTEVVSRLIEGTYPQYQRIMQSAYETRAIVDTAQMVKAVRLANLFTAADVKYVKLQFVPGQAENFIGGIHLSSNVAEVGKNSGEVDADITGKANTIAVSTVYLADALAVVGTSQVALEMQDDKLPLVIRPVGTDDYIYVTMPVSMK